MKKIKAKRRKLELLLAVVFCCAANVVSAQYSEKNSPVNTEDLKKAEQILRPKVTLYSFSHLNAKHCYLPTLGAFCVLENKIEKKATFPVKMRLGSVDYVDKLENKRN